MTINRARAIRASNWSMVKPPRKGPGQRVGVGAWSVGLGASAPDRRHQTRISRPSCPWR
jgi:hypothetical protein